jgi:hypothetical protein
MNEAALLAAVGARFISMPICMSAFEGDRRTGKESRLTPLTPGS